MRHDLRSLCLAFAALVGLGSVTLSAPAFAQESGAALPALDEQTPARVRLVANVDTAPREEPFYVAAFLEMAPDWHVYWTFPGNTGQPTRVTFAADPKIGMVAEPQFPPPKIYDADKTESLSFGYADSVLIPAEAVVFDPETQTFELSATVTWLACKHLCVKGKATPTLSLPVGAEAEPSEWAERIEAGVASTPEILDPEQAWLESLIYEKGRYELKLVVTDIGEVERFVPAWLVGGACKVVDFGSEKDPQGRTILRMSLAGDLCLPATGAVVVASAPGGGGEAKAYRIEAAAPLDQPPDAPAPTGPGVEPAAGPSPLPKTLPSGGGESILLLLFFAFIGGLLLNIMPCVIPVVVPKLLGVVRTAEKGDTPAAKRSLLLKSGIAYFAGVEATMLGLGVTVAALKLAGHEVGWGFQFQNPWFLTFMIALVVVLALGMLDVFSLKSSQHQGQMSWLAKRFYKSPVLGSFLTGLLVTFLGTPCTAPLLGPALGYAFTASNLVVISFLLMVGVGLALPFLLLGVWTGWTRILPRKVSERYDRAMRGLAFLLLATAAWLLGVMAEGYSGIAAMNVVWFVLALAFAAWLYGQVTTSADPLQRRFAILLPLLTVVLFFGAWILEFPSGEEARAASLHSGVIEWEAFSDAKLAEEREAGKTVFIDFTADWCMNCKANERLVIEKEETKAIVERLEIAVLKADHTRFDPEIHAWLKRFNRAGVPMYLIFPACAGDEEAVLLPEVLTGKMLHGALEQAGASRDDCP